MKFYLLSSKIGNAFDITTDIERKNKSDANISDLEKLVLQLMLDL
ncbi:hypothetical protein [Lederbergia citri]|nr:hypothetical protein [Lederbergia citri]